MNRKSIDPIAALKIHMVENKVYPRDLKPLLGSSAKVSEILNYKRTLSLNMIRALHRSLGIPLEILVQEYEKK